MTWDERVGKAIAESRRLRGIPQTKLCVQLGMAQNVLSAYECGKRQWTVERIVRFSEAIGVLPLTVIEEVFEGYQPRQPPLPLDTQPSASR